MSNIDNYEDIKDINNHLNRIVLSIYNENISTYQTSMSSLIEYLDGDPVYESDVINSISNINQMLMFRDNISMDFLDDIKTIIETNFYHLIDYDSFSILYSIIEFLTGSIDKHTIIDRLSLIWEDDTRRIQDRIDALIYAGRIILYTEVSPLSNEEYLELLNSLESKLV